MGVRSVHHLGREEESAVCVCAWWGVGGHVRTVPPGCAPSLRTPSVLINTVLMSSRCLSTSCGRRREGEAEAPLFAGPERGVVVGGGGWGLGGGRGIIIDGILYLYHIDYRVTQGGGRGG